MTHKLLKTGIRACLGLGFALILHVAAAEAKCAAPEISLNAESVKRGGTLTITGEAFWDRCDDFQTPGGTSLPVRGAKNIKIILKQANGSKQLLTVDADSNLRFSVNVTVPIDAAIGTASIVADLDIYMSNAGRNMPAPVKFDVVESTQ